MCAAHAASGGGGGKKSASEEERLKRLKHLFFDRDFYSKNNLHYLIIKLNLRPKSFFLNWPVFHAQDIFVCFFWRENVIYLQNSASWSLNGMSWLLRTVKVFIKVHAQ